MPRPEKLYRTTIVVWTDYPPNDMELADLAREATIGDALCDYRVTEVVTDAGSFPDDDGFFGTDGGSRPCR